MQIRAVGLWLAVVLLSQRQSTAPGGIRTRIFPPKQDGALLLCYWGESQHNGRGRTGDAPGGIRTRTIGL